MQSAKKCSLYEQLEALPEGLTGEILNGQLHTTPRPTWPHGRVEGKLNRKIGGGYDDGDGGPGGWWIAIEPEIHFILDKEICVPDLAGWRRERMPSPTKGHKITVVPDWLCEVLSPSTESKDRNIKMPIYAHYGVKHAWLVDPQEKTLEAFELREGEWAAVGSYRDQDAVSIVPFDAIIIDLADLWA